MVDEPTSQEQLRRAQRALYDRTKLAFDAAQQSHVGGQFHTWSTTTLLATLTTAPGLAFLNTIMINDSNHDRANPAADLPGVLDEFGEAGIRNPTIIVATNEANTTAQLTALGLRPAGTRPIAIRTVVAAGPSHDRRQPLSELPPQTHPSQQQQSPPQLVVPETSPPGSGAPTRPTPNSDASLVPSSAAGPAAGAAAGPTASAGACPAPCVEAGPAASSGAEPIPSAGSMTEPSSDYPAPSDRRQGLTAGGGFERSGGRMENRCGVQSDTQDAGLVVRRAATASDREVFCDVMLAGYSGSPEVQQYIRADHAAPGVIGFVAWRDDLPVAGAALSWHEDAVVLGGAATAEQWRGCGAQSALVQTRLRVVADSCPSGDPVVVTATAAPDSPSLRNLHRAGFAIRYRYAWQPNP